MSCECCEENEGIIDCKECSPVQGKWRVLCADCSAFIHRGAYKNHLLISPDTKKKRDEVKEKIAQHKKDRQWEENVVVQLQSIRKDIEERQHLYEEDIKKRVTDVHQKLKQRGISMIQTIKEMTNEKLEVLDDLSKKLNDNVRSGKETETKIDALIADISEFEKEFGAENETEAKLTYELLEWDKFSFPKLCLPLNIDYSKIESAADELRLELVVDMNSEVGDDNKESKPSDVGLQSRIDQQGVFWIHVDFLDETLNKLLNISFDIRSKHIVERDWKTYGELDQKPEIGEIVYALWNYDNKWYRGRVDELSSSQATVVFVDFGNSEKIDFGSILPIGEHSVSDLPFQALECSLFPEPKEIPLNVKFEFTDMIAGGPLHCKVLGKCKFGAKEITHIELIKDMPDGSQLNLKEYLESRCNSKKTKENMPFNSRDIRILENPNAFDKPSPVKSDTDSTKSPMEGEGEPAKSPMKKESNEESKPEETNENEKKPTESEQQEEVKTKEEPATNGTAEATPVLNGHVENTEEVKTETTSVKVEPVSEDIIVESEDVEESFDVPVPSVYPGEVLKIHFDPANHSLSREGAFWATLHRNEQQEAEWQRFEKVLSDVGEKAEMCSNISEGGIILAKFRGQWHRAKIDQVTQTDQNDQKKKVKVRLTDRGISVSIAESQLRVMPLKYVTIPPQAIKCSIATEQMKEFPSDSKTHFVKMVETKLLHGHILSVEGTKETCLSVTLFDKNGPEPIDIGKRLHERETNRIRRALDAEELAPQPGVLHVKRTSNDDSWVQDDVTGFDGQQQQHLAGGQGPQAMMDGDALLGTVMYDPHQAQPQQQYLQQQQHAPHMDQQHQPQPGSYGAYHQDQYHQGRQDARSGGDYGGNRRTGGGGGRDNRWRGDQQRGGSACYKCGDPNHYSKNCPNDKGQYGGGGRQQGGRSRNRRQ